MDIIANTDLFSVGIAIATSFILGFVVFYQNPKSDTGKLFLLFTGVNAGWSIFNYLNYHVSNPLLVLWFIRMVMFFAVLQAFSFFLLMFSFPQDNVAFPSWWKIFILPAVSLTALLTLTPWVFSGLQIATNGAVSQPIPAAGIGIFAIVAVTSVAWGVVLLVLKIRQAPPEQKTSFKYLLAGVAIMFACIITLNFILPSYFQNTRFIPLSAVFTFPFVAFTAYAIMRHHLFNVKILSTEIFVFLLSVITLFEVITAGNFLNIILRTSEFLLVLSIGIMLINSVIREVKQRERLEILDKELADANDKLKILDQARAEFITIASHQLRTPPATIKWYLSAILSGDYGKVPAKILAQLKKTENTNNHLISLIEDMLNVSRIERGKMEFLFEPTDTEELARFSYEQLLPIAQEKGLALTYSPPPRPLPKIMADKEKLRQVMNNLIDNALKYTKQGSIAVNLFLLGSSDAKGGTGKIIFQVKDSGKGISAEERESIFQKYTRGKESVKQSAGLGLGLYVAKIIIEQHKGKIWAESPGEGQGSMFCFSLPVNSGLEETTMVDLGNKTN
jgi:signal transduction histidine kinase